MQAAGRETGTADLKMKELDTDTIQAILTWYLVLLTINRTDRLEPGAEKPSEESLDDNSIWHNYCN